MASIREVTEQELTEKIKTKLGPAADQLTPISQDLLSGNVDPEMLVSVEPSRDNIILNGYRANDLRVRLHLSHEDDYVIEDIETTDPDIKSVIVARTNPDLEKLAGFLPPTSLLSLYKIFEVRKPPKTPEIIQTTVRIEGRQGVSANSLRYWRSGSRTTLDLETDSTTSPKSGKTTWVYNRY